MSSEERHNQIKNNNNNADLRAFRKNGFDVFNAKHMEHSTQAEKGGNFLENVTPIAFLF